MASMLKELWEILTGATAAKKIQVGIDGWNTVVEHVLQLITQNPEDFKGGGAWSYIANMYQYLTVIAASLLAVIMLYRMCKETLDIRQEMRFEGLIKMLISFVLSEAVVINSLTITKLLFRLAGGFANLFMGTYVPLAAPESLETMKVGILECVVLIFICIAFYVLSFALLYIVYFRFLKIYIIAPLSAIAYATFAGGHDLSRIGFSYLKTMAAYVFEIVIIVLAINIGNRMGSAGSDIFVDNVIWQCLDPLLTAGLVVGSAKGAEGILRKAFGL